MIYAYPALVALVVKGGMVWWSRRLLLDTWPFFAFLLCLAVHNLFEVGFYLSASPETKTVMMYGYYVAAVLALGFGLVFGVALWKPSMAKKAGTIMAGCASVIVVLIVHTDYLIAGFQPFSFSYTRIPGPGYPIFTLYALVCLAGMVTAIVLSIKSASSNYIKARNSLILAGFAPFVLVAGMVPLLMSLGLAVNAAMLIPITTTIFLLVVLYAFTHDSIFDVRSLLVGTDQFRRLKRLVAHVAVVQRTPENSNPNDLLHDLELEIYQQALKKTKGNKTHAAQHLGIHPNTLRYRLKKLDIG